MRVIAAPAALVLILGTCSCTNEEGASSSEENSATATETEAKKEVQEAVEAVTNLAGEKAKEFQETMKKKLASIDQRIDALKSKATQAAVAGKTELQEQIQKLSEKRQALQKKLEDLGSRAEGAWEEMKTGLEAAYDDLEKAVDEAATHFSDTEKAGSTAEGDEG
jgi:chromosome segregation ATPase